MSDHAPDSKATPRELSFWGWGFADRFPDTAARQRLGQMASGLLGLGPLTATDPPTLDSIRLPASRLTVPAELAAFTTDERTARVRRTWGRGYKDLIRGFRGDFSAAPDLVALPPDEAAVAQILRWASSQQVAVIPRGGGTSVTGGVEAAVGDGYRGVLCLDLGRMNRVLSVDPISRTACIQAGALGPHLEAGLAPHGLTLRHFPQSFAHSTLGGWVATRAGGHFATVYTHIDDLVAAIRMVTPTGDYASWPLPGSGAGPAPDRMVLGSEGTLGVITEATVRVRPRPDRRASATVRFDTFEAAAEAARAIAQSGLYPSNCRVLDRTEATLNQVPAGGKHVLILGFEGVGRDLRPAMTDALALATAAGGVCPDGPKLREGDRRQASPTKAGAAEAWRSAFIDAPYLQTIFVSLGVLVDTFETACPWSAFPALDRALHKRVGQAMTEVAGGGTLTRRFTHVYPDGPAPYYTFLCPARQGAELEQWQAIKTAASDTLAAHGATITHHHAVGRTHRPWYDQQRPEPFARALRATKRELDPAWILNPGVLLDPEG